MPDELHRRVSVVLEVDRMFTDYAIGLKPDEARAFTRLSESLGQPVDTLVFTLLTLLDETIPPADRGTGHPQTGQPYHSYRIGRQVGRRILILELLKVNLSPNFEPMTLIHTLQKYATSVNSVDEYDEDDIRWSASFVWADQQSRLKELP